MSSSYSHKVPNKVSTQRIQEYGVGIFDLIPTKSALKKALKKGQIQVNDRIATTATLIQGGETIVYTPAKIQIPDRTFILDLNVLYEDDSLAIVEKPAGILVSGNTFKTVENALPQNLKISQQGAALPRPVHRLDFATTGALLIGKTSDSIRTLAKLFENKEIDKYYYAITIGTMPEEGIIDQRIDGKEAVTHFKKVDALDSPRFQQLNLVTLHPMTGRRHQLRLHLAGIGNPILGDRDYSPENLLLKGKGMYLHAHSLSFDHPYKGERLWVQAPLPKRFTKLFPVI